MENVERVNLCFKSIEILINGRENESFLEVGSEYAFSFRFELVSSYGVFLRISESERRVCVMDL